MQFYSDVKTILLFSSDAPASRKRIKEDPNFILLMFPSYVYDITSTSI